MAHDGYGEVPVDSTSGLPEHDGKKYRMTELSVFLDILFSPNIGYLSKVEHRARDGLTKSEFVMSLYEHKYRYGHNGVTDGGAAPCTALLSAGILGCYRCRWRASVPE